MLDKIYLNKEKIKYKGQLHCHTTRSDGVLPEKEVIKKYKEKNYNFVLLSDHRIYWANDKYDEKNFIVLNGYEADVDTGGYPNQDFHFQCLSNEENIENKFEHEKIYNAPKYEGMSTVQKMLDKEKERGNITILNHPNWSRNKLDIFKLKGFFALEIYNHCSEVDESCGFALDYWDEALRNGYKIFGVASDDSHTFKNDRDYDGGWIEVESENLTKKEIVDKLQKGVFYSTMGPQINDLRVVDGVIYIECSPVEKINFKTSHMRGVAKFPLNGEETLEKAQYKIRDIDKWIRIECIDKFGKIAWSNPIFIGEIK